MKVVPYVMIHSNQNNDALPPPIPPKSANHQGRMMALQASSNRPPAVQPRPEHTENVQLRQGKVNFNDNQRLAVYAGMSSLKRELPTPPEFDPVVSHQTPPSRPAPIPPSRPAPIPPSRMHEFMEPPSFHAPSPPVSQERSRMPLPGEGLQRSLAQRRAAPQLAPFTQGLKTGHSLNELNKKCAQQFVRDDYIDKGNAEYLNGKIVNISDCKVEHQRFGNINTCKATQLVTSKGVGLPANQLIVDGEKAGMRSQYPTTQKLGSQLTMYAEQKPAVVVVLASDKDIEARNLPPYFRENKHYNDAQYDQSNADKYDDVSVRCLVNKKLPVKEAGNLTVKNYRNEITVNGKTTPISVMHVTNWADFTTVGSKEIEILASDILKKIEQKIKEDSSYSPQALIHCSAGAGRAGTLLAAINLLIKSNNGELDKNSDDELDDTLIQMRNTGTSAIVQTEAQYDTLAEFYAKKKSGH